jgi:hypothetical protein
VQALAGTGPADVWAGGDGLRHFDGAGWKTVPGLPDGEVLALAPTPAGVLLVLDVGNGQDEQQSLLEVTRPATGAYTTALAAGPPDLRALWVAPGGSGEAWAAGFDVTTLRSRLLHRAAGGKPFTAVANPGQTPLTALWGAAPDDLWAGGTGLLLHWDGATWAQAAGIDPGVEVHALWGVGPADVYAAAKGGALHYDGAAWRALPPPIPDEHRLARAVWGSGPRNLWLAGEAGLLWQGDRAVLSAYSPAPAPFLEAVSATGPSDAWAVGGLGTALHWDGAAWRPGTTGVADPISAVWARTATDAWLAGASADCTGFILHWDGARWGPSLVGKRGYCFTGLSGTGPADVWAAAAPGLFHFTGAGWAVEGPSDVSGAVWAASASEVFALQESISGGATPPGGVWHLSGGTWSLETTDALAPLRRVWGSGPGDVWAAGDDGASLWHRLPSGAWQEVASGLGDPTIGLAALWGSGPSDVYAGSRGGPVLLHWDGQAWSPAGEGAGLQSVTGLGGSGPGDLWVVGGNGDILRRRR